jgi:hypothetical protein
MVAVLLLPASAILGIPATPHTFTQRTDHFGTDAATFSQRYYMNDTAFGGPGSPLLVIMGGEGAIPPTTGFFYPFVVDVLAPKFKALVLEPEHRFYGTSMPTAYERSALQRLMSPQQALADAIRLIVATQAARNCTGCAPPLALSKPSR